MSENPKEGKQTGTGAGTGTGEKPLAKEINVTATVDPTQLEGLITQIKDKEEEIKTLKATLETTTTDKEAVTTKLGEAESVRDDFKSKLSLIAKQELDKKKAMLMTEAKKFVTDEDRLKVIEDGIKGPEDIATTVFLIETIKTTLEEGARQHEALLTFEAKRKSLNAPETIKTEEELVEWEKTQKASGDADPTRKPSSGTLTLKGQNTGNEDGYDSHAIMVRDLRKRSHSANPEESAAAKSVLKELFRKWAVAVKAGYEGKSSGVRIEKGKEQASLRDITKLGGGAREEEPQEGS